MTFQEAFAPGTGSAKVVLAKGDTLNEPAAPARHELAVGQIFRQSFVLAWRAAPMLIPLAILSEVLGRGMSWLITRTDPFIVMAGVQRNRAVDPFESLLLVPGQFIRGLVSAASVWVAYTAFRGGRPTPDGLLTAWSRALIPLMLLQALLCAVGLTNVPLQWGMQAGNHAPLALGLSLIGLLIWSVAYCYVVLLLWLAPNVAIIEGCGTCAAMRRSATLTLGNRWRILGIGILVGGAVVIAMFALWAVSGVGVPPRAALSMLTPVGALSFLLQIAVGIAFATSSAIVYSDLGGATDVAPHADAFS